MVKFIAAAATIALMAKNYEDIMIKFFLLKTWLNPVTTD
jgi:hypothetical protein